MAQPRVITEQKVEPVYQKIVNQPMIEREQFEVVPQYVRQPTQHVNRRPTTEATKFTQSTSTRTVTVPGDERHVQEVQMPSVLIQNEQLKINKSRPQVMRSPAQTAPTKTRVSVNKRVVSTPGDQYFTREIIQPIQEREFVNVQVQRPPDRVVNHRPVTEPAVVRNRVRNQKVDVQGDLLITQKHIYPKVITERVNVKFTQPPVERITAKPIMKKTIRTKTVERKYHDAVTTIPVEKVVHVPTPVVTKIPVYLGT